MIEIYGADSFVIEIRKVFSEGSEQERIEKCIKWENKIIKKVIGNPMWINRFYSDGTIRHEEQKLIGQKRIAQEKQILGEEQFRELQKQRGLLAGQEALSRDPIWWKKFHSQGASASHKKRRELKSQLGYDPFLTENGRKNIALACSEIFKNSVEMWHPSATVTNKSQSDYVKGQCVRCKKDSEKYHDLIQKGFLTIEEHMKKFNKMSKKEYQNLSDSAKQNRRQKGWDKMSKITSQQIEKIIELKKLGKKWKEISEEIGFPDWYCLRKWKSATLRSCLKFCEPES